MSKRRKPGDIVRRKPGSGFLGSADPERIRIPSDVSIEDETIPCMLDCGDRECQEWANLEVVEGEFKDSRLYHISECEMFDD